MPAKVSGTSKTSGNGSSGTFKFGEPGRTNAALITPKRVFVATLTSFSSLPVRLARVTRLYDLPVRHPAATGTLVRASAGGGVAKGVFFTRVGYVPAGTGVYTVESCKTP